MSPEHKVLDMLQHIWPYVSGFFLVLFAAVKLGWHRWHTLRERVKNVEVLAENSAGQLIEMKEQFKLNHEEHNDILKTILKLHSGDHRHDD